ncbi:hypothetical protein WME75_37000 [Sorangium sp. So ce1014]|uniref:hypothetical protein n=1 Tax=Sorangium sp. So ce1014 TaxID=3133326 RepID=UPI003F5F0F2D
MADSELDNLARLDSSMAQTAQARRMSLDTAFLRGLLETWMSSSSLLLNTQRTWKMGGTASVLVVIWPRVEGPSVSVDLAVCSIMERSLHVGAAGVSAPRTPLRRVIAARAPRHQLAFDEMTQDDQDVESHLVVLSGISPFGIELIVKVDIYSCFLCGA